MFVYSICCAFLRLKSVFISWNRNAEVSMECRFVNISSNFGFVELSILIPFILPEISLKVFAVYMLGSGVSVAVSVGKGVGHFMYVQSVTLFVGGG